jgi:hypothetical protein
MRRKPKKLETVTHGPFKADIRLDAESGTFECDYGGERFASAALLEVRKWAVARLRTCAELDWKPIMKVNFDALDDRVNNLKNCANIRCYLERFHIAWDGKKWYSTPWVVMPRGTYMCSGPQPDEMEQEQHPMPPQELMEQRIAHAREFYVSGIELTDHLIFPLVSGESLGSQDYYVPYTPERWATMLGLLEKIRELRTRIHQLLACDTGWAKLAAIAGTKLLAAPPQAPEDGHNSAGHNWRNPVDASDVS